MAPQAAPGRRSKPGRLSPPQRPGNSTSAFPVRKTGRIRPTFFELSYSKQYNPMSKSGANPPHFQVISGIARPNRAALAGRRWQVVDSRHHFLFLLWHDLRAEAVNGAEGGRRKRLDRRGFARKENIPWRCERGPERTRGVSRGSRHRRVQRGRLPLQSAKSRAHGVER